MCAINSSTTLWVALRRCWMYLEADEEVDTGQPEQILKINGCNHTHSFSKLFFFRQSLSISYVIPVSGRFIE